MSPGALTVAAHVNCIVLPIDVLILMDYSPATLRVLLGTIEKNRCLIVYHWLWFGEVSSGMTQDTKCFASSTISLGGL